MIGQLPSFMFVSRFRCYDRSRRILDMQWSNFIGATQACFSGTLASAAKAGLVSMTHFISDQRLYLLESLVSENFVAVTIDTFSFSYQLKGK